MTLPAAILDTNLVVSGLIASAGTSPTNLILDAMLAGRFTYLLSLDLLAEYRDVLVRSSIRRRHGLTDAEVDIVLTELALNGTMLDPGPAAVAPPDTGDRHLWALLEHAPTAVLVTGDDALRTRASEPSRILSPRQFFERLSRFSPDAP